jgi:hypothetical protein
MPQSAPLMTASRSIEIIRSLTSFDALPPQLWPFQVLGVRLPLFIRLAKSITPSEGA